MVTFIMLVGVPGSGKSTLAKKVAAEYQAEIISTDRLRWEITGSETDFSRDGFVFKTAREKIVNFLNNQINVVYDATNITRADRRKILKIIPENIYKICYYQQVTLKTAIHRNLNRKRVVPVHIIHKMYLKLNVPVLEEGWDSIKTVNG